MNILIATGIYPPEIGGPAEYAKQLDKALYEQGFRVSVVTYGSLKRFPTGIRHFLYFLRFFFKTFSTDYIIALDPFSVGFPALLYAKLFRKKIVVRIGGDFLWESFAERTKEKVLLSDFYTKPRNFNFKEKTIFKIISFVLKNVDKVIFSTKWQRDIMQKPYNIILDKTEIVENFYPKTSHIKNVFTTEKKVFLSPSRDIFIKNKKTVEEAFSMVQKNYPNIELDTKTLPHSMLLEKIKNSYAVIVASLSEVSPNLVFDAFQCGVPVIVTKDTGISEYIKNLAVFVDPLSVSDISSGIIKLLDSEIYNSYANKITTDTRVHSWDEIIINMLNSFRIF